LGGGGFKKNLRNKEKQNKHTKTKDKKNNREKKIFT
jgi:hypothetical protein